MSSRPRTIRQEWPATSVEVTARRQQRHDLLDEHEVADGVWEQASGPFIDYRRTLVVDDTTAVQTIIYRTNIPWFSWLFRVPLYRQLRRPSSASTPWWAPPTVLTARQAMVLGLLAATAMMSTFCNTLFTQTGTYVADSFGISTSGLGRAGVVVRLGIVIAIPLTTLADWTGRRRMIIAAVWIAPLVCALGALAPTFWSLVATQAIGRPIALASFVIGGVILTEEMPKDARAYALSVTSLAGGIGALVAVGNLWLADVATQGWRLIYALSLLWVFVAVSVTRGMPETARFRQATQRASTDPPLARRPRLRRFVSITVVAVLANIFVAPASFFQNDYLKEVRNMSGLWVSIFTIVTTTPSSLGLIVGGRLADSIGRRWLLLLCIPTSTALLATSFAVDGPAMWLTTLAGGVLAGLAYPAFIVYRGEMFGTGSRSTANGLILALSLAGSSVGLLLVGEMVDGGRSYGVAIALAGGFQVVAAVLAFFTYPETVHRELEELNPEDARHSPRDSQDLV